MNTKPDTVDVLLAVAWEVAEAVLILAVAGLALMLTLSRTGTKSSPSSRAGGAPAATTAARPAPSPARPAVHPLSELAATLEQQPASALRELAGTRSRRRSKRELVAALVAC